MHTISSDLKFSALRIFLTYHLLQAEDVCRTCRFQMSISTSVAVKELWQNAVDLSVELIIAINDCQQKVAHAACFLSVMDSMQSSLREAMDRARKRDVDDHQGHGQRSEAFSVRAMFLTNGLNASSVDQKLASLWFLAAQKLQGEIELNFSAACWAGRCDRSNHFVSDVASIERSWVHVKAALQMKQIDKVKFHYRYAAALAALGRPHSHDFAAELCMKAFLLGEKETNMKNSGACHVQNSAVVGEVTLFKKAASSWQLAAEMVAAQADENGTLQDDPTIQSVVTSAKKFEADAKLVATFVVTMDKQKAVAAASNDIFAQCRDATMIPGWRAFTTRQDAVLAEAVSRIEGFVNGESSADGVSVKMAPIRSNADVIAENLQERQLCITKFNYYKERAAQALQGAHPSPLACKCWTQAAKYSDAAAALHASIMISDEQHLIVHTRTLLLKKNLANDCAYIAENVLGCAVEYLNKARGAEAGVNNGRDPREAQMWHKAADYQVQTAKYNLDEVFLREQRFDPSQPFRDTKTAASVNGFALAAEYLYLAYMHRALPDAETRQNGTRVAVLYKSIASIMATESDLSTLGDVHIKIVAPHLALIKSLNESEVIAEEVIAARELACKYSRFAHCSSVSTDRQLLWNAAQEIQTRAVVYESSNKNFQVGSAVTCMYACAAETETLSERLCLESAAGSLARAFEPNYGKQRLALYYKVVAQSILSLSPGSIVLPTKVSSLLAQVTEQSRGEEELRIMAEEHARYVTLRNRFQLWEVDHAHEVWMSPLPNVNTLIGLLCDRAVNIYAYNTKNCLSARIKYYALLVRIFVARTEAPPDSAFAVCLTTFVKWVQEALHSQEGPAYQTEIEKRYEKALARIWRTMDEIMAENVEDSTLASGSVEERDEGK